MSKLLHYLIILGWCVVSCRNDSNPNQDSPLYLDKKIRLIKYTEDSLVTNGGQELFLQHAGNVMGLPKIIGEREKLNVRIWAWDSDSSHVITISDGLSPRVYAVQFGSKLIDSTNYIAIYKQWNALVPKSGWEHFFEKLKSYQITVLETNLNRQRYPTVLGGSYVDFEIVQNNSYRYYRHFEPSYFRYVSKSSGNIYNFLEFLNDEMNIHVYNGDKRFYMKPVK